jgi:hypothetical protein
MVGCWDSDKSGGLVKERGTSVCDGSRGNMRFDCSWEHRGDEREVMICSNAESETETETI